ncbi:dihydromonapterin reductase [Spartinivicinus poritis]|uniref:Dihydromonapterin reductase n=1 Tax=Spartinivicinus poritis TaxID=2994640 RepID=A0ABT5U2A2_9GAMM|nr:dihydromonapterin reductase [Spartinivicinus sp. A2-2]MDE1460491.1 dihydromonapterin reductase [Spartinivicinus sp. A2-2]
MFKPSTAPVLITGGAQRVGYHCAQRFAKLGQPVIISYRQHHENVDKLTDLDVKCIQADFSSSEQTLAFIQELASTTPSLRAIIHNASSWLTEEDATMPPEQLMSIMTQVHMMAPYLINLHCQSLLKNAKETVTDIIHITDCVVAKGSYSHIAYTASKAGLDNMTRSFAKQYAPDIKVNTIAPALLMFHPDDPTEYKEKSLSKSLLGIEPGPEVLFEALCFLLGNRYMTGHTLTLDGGRTIK